MTPYPSRAPKRPIMNRANELPQVTFTCSISAIQAIVKVVKYVQINGVFIISLQCISHLLLSFFPAEIFLFKVHTENTKIISEIFSR